jgi:hypothetical protein
VQKRRREMHKKAEKVRMRQASIPERAPASAEAKPDWVAATHKRAAAQILAQQKAEARASKRPCVGKDCSVGAIRAENPAPKLGVWGANELRRYMRANNYTMADALRFRLQTFQQEVTK